MSEHISRCLACFELHKGDGVCPFCGYDPKNSDIEAVMLFPGTVLKNRYLMGKVLGSGGFGITYLAWDKLFDKRVAVKEYLPSEYSTRGKGETRITVFSGNKAETFRKGKTKFLEEAQTLARFQTEPSIVNVMDSFEENGTAYYVMEYIDGKTLSKHLQERGRFSEEETICLLRPIMESLKEMHAQGILHRDIAPDNIMVTQEGQAKLIDFGSARYTSFNSNEKSLTVMVKQGYSAPEQYLSKGAQGPFTDVYALGATMYKMLTGITPPESLERKTELMENGVDTLKPINDNISVDEEIWNAIYDAMNVFLKKRIQTIEEFLDRLVCLEKDDNKLNSREIDTHDTEPEANTVVLVLPNSTETAEAGNALLCEDTDMTQFVQHPKKNRMHGNGKMILDRRWFIIASGSFLVLYAIVEIVYVSLSFFY